MENNDTPFILSSSGFCTDADADAHAPPAAILSSVVETPTNFNVSSSFSAPTTTSTSASSSSSWEGGAPNVGIGGGGGGGGGGVRTSAPESIASSAFMNYDSSARPVTATFPGSSNTALSFPRPSGTTPSISSFPSFPPPPPPTTTMTTSKPLNNNSSNINRNNFTNPSPPPMPSAFRTLRQLTGVTKKEKVDVVGIVVSSVYPKPSKGSDHKSGICVIDETLASPSSDPVLIQYFAPGNERNSHPLVTSLGDIVRVHRADITLFGSRLQVNAYVKFGSYIEVYHQDGSESTTFQHNNMPIPSGNTYVRSRVSFLQRWWKQYVSSQSCCIPRDHFLTIGAASVPPWKRSNGGRYGGGGGGAGYGNSSSNGRSEQYVDFLARIVAFSDDFVSLQHRWSDAEAGVAQLNEAKRQLSQQGGSSTSSSSSTIASSSASSSSVATTTTTMDPRALQRLIRSMDVYLRDPYTYLGIDGEHLDYSIFVWDGTEKRQQEVGGGGGGRIGENGSSSSSSSSSSSNMNNDDENPYSKYVDTPEEYADSLGSPVPGTVLRLRIDFHSLEILALRLVPGSWIRARNIKVVIDQGPAAGYEFLANPPKAYFGEGAGLLKLDTAIITAPNSSSSSSSSSCSRNIPLPPAEAYLDIARLLRRNVVAIVPPDSGGVGYMAAETSFSSSTSSSSTASVGTDPEQRSLPLQQQQFGAPVSRVVPQIQPQQQRPGYGVMNINGVSSSSSGGGGGRVIGVRGNADADVEIMWVTRVLLPELPVTHIRDIWALIHASTLSSSSSSSSVSTTTTTTSEYPTFVFRVRAIALAVVPFDIQNMCRPVSEAKKELATTATAAISNLSNSVQKRHKPGTGGSSTDIGSTTAPLYRELSSLNDNLFSSSDTKVSSERDQGGGAPVSVLPTTNGQHALDELPSSAEYFYHFALRLQDIETSSSSSSSLSSSSSAAASSSSTVNAMSFPSYLDALVFGEDAETFLPGLSACNLHINTETATAVRTRIRQLYRPGSAVECCIKAYWVPVPNRSQEEEKKNEGSRSAFGENHLKRKAMTMASSSNGKQKEEKEEEDGGGGGDNNNSSIHSSTPRMEARFRIFKTVLLPP